MTLEEILEKMVRFEELVEPNEMVIISGYIAGYITDLQLELDESKLAYAMRWEELKYSPVGKPFSDKVTDIKMLREPVYQNLNRVKRTLGELKRYRSDLNRKIDVIMGIKRRT